MTNLKTTINVKVSAKDKEKATEILHSLGLTMSDLINMTIKQVIMRGGIPFEVREPQMSNDMKTALEELDYIEKHLDEYKKNNKWEDLKKELM